MVSHVCDWASSAWLKAERPAGNWARWRDRFLAFTEPIRVELRILGGIRGVRSGWRCQNKLCHQRKGKWNGIAWSLLLTARPIGQQTRRKRNGDDAESVLNHIQGRLITTHLWTLLFTRLWNPQAILFLLLLLLLHGPQLTNSPDGATFFAWPLSPRLQQPWIRFPERKKNLFYSQKLHECT